MLHHWVYVITPSSWCQDSKAHVSRKAWVREQIAHPVSKLSRIPNIFFQKLFPSNESQYYCNWTKKKVLCSNYCKNLARSHPRFFDAIPVNFAARKESIRAQWSLGPVFRCENLRCLFHLVRPANGNLKVRRGWTLSCAAVQEFSESVAGSKSHCNISKRSHFTACHKVLSSWPSAHFQWFSSLGSWKLDVLFPPIYLFVLVLRIQRIHPLPLWAQIRWVPFDVESDRILQNAIDRMLEVREFISKNPSGLRWISNFYLEACELRVNGYRYLIDFNSFTLGCPSWTYDFSIMGNDGWLWNHGVLPLKSQT